MAIKVKAEYNELINLFNKLTGKRNMWQVFNDVITMIACSVQSQFSTLKRFKQVEELYMNTAVGYSKEELLIVCQIFAKITDMLNENPFRDLLGDLYMQLEMGNNELGQFFTPYNIAKLVAESCVDIDKAKGKINERGYIVINEPACGGGANVIGLCDVLYNNGINYQQKCIVVCQDLSRLTGLMCYIILSLIGCSAVIKIGDTLSKPFTTYVDELKTGSELWTTPMFHANNCYDKV